MFVGHFHRWFVAGREGIGDWRGETAVTLPADDRSLVGVGAVCVGQCGLFDTAALRLTPIDVRGGP